MYDIGGYVRYHSQSRAHVENPAHSVDERFLGTEKKSHHRQRTLHGSVPARFRIVCSFTRRQIEKKIIQNGRGADAQKRPRTAAAV